MRRLGLLFLALVATPPANAQLACTAMASPVNFGSISLAGAGTYDARGSFTVSCTGSNGANIAVCASLAQGATDVSGERLLSPPKGTSALPMQIFLDPGLARPWGAALPGRRLFCSARATDR